MSTHVVIFVCFLAGYRFDFIVLILVIVIFMKVELVFFFIIAINTIQMGSKISA